MALQHDVAALDQGMRVAQHQLAVLEGAGLSRRRLQRHLSGCGTPAPPRPRTEQLLHELIERPRRGRSCTHPRPRSRGDVGAFASKSSRSSRGAGGVGGTLPSLRPSLAGRVSNNRAGVVGGEVLDDGGRPRRPGPSRSRPRHSTERSVGDTIRQSPAAELLLEGGDDVGGAERHVGAHLDHVLADGSAREVSVRTEQPGEATHPPGWSARHLLDASGDSHGRAGHRGWPSGHGVLRDLRLDGVVRGPRHGHQGAQSPMTGSIEAKSRCRSAGSWPVAASDDSVTKLGGRRRARHGLAVPSEIM